MNKPEQDDFTVSFDAGENEGIYVGEALEKRVDSLGWRVTLLTVIVPCLIAVVIVMAYFGITRKVADVKETGTAAVKNMAQAYDQQVIALEAAQQELQSNLDQVREDLQKDLTSVDKTAAAGVRAAKDRISQAVTQVGSLEKKVASLEKRLTDLAAKTTTLTETLAAVQKDLDTLAADMKNLKSGKADKTTLDQRLADLESKMRTLVEQAGGKSENRLVALSERLQRLEERVNTLEKAPAAKNGGHSAPFAPVPGTTGGEENGIVEEDLSQ
ncbi:MAG: hypothetical protein ACLFPD_04240 [Desulfosudaceae bacterium]